MTKSKGFDVELVRLLELDGEVFPMDNGYWTKIEVKRVRITEHIPHGIKYSLTLHDRNNRRVLGYDNAHGIKPVGNRFSVMNTEWDHRHERDRMQAYKFEGAGQLLEDFWNDVNKILDGAGR